MQECDTVQCLVLIAFLWPAQLSFAPHQLIAGVKWRQLRGFNLDKRRSSRQICWVSCCRHWKRIRLGVKWRRRRANAHPSTNLNVFFSECQSIDVSLRMHPMNDEHLINGKLMNFALRNLLGDLWSSGKFNYKRHVCKFNLRLVSHFYSPRASSATVNVVKLTIQWISWLCEWMMSCW